MFTKNKFMVIKNPTHVPELILMPKRATHFSAGYDFITPGVFDPITLKPGEKYTLKTNIKCRLDKNKALLIMPKSGLGNKGLHLTNVVALIDADHFENPENDGEISITLVNNSDTPIDIGAGQKIVQAVFIKYYKTSNDYKYKKAKRVKKGFGSTGR